MIDTIEVMKWNSIRHFKAAEFGKNWHLLDFDLVVLIDRMRELVGCPIHINCAWADDGHSKKSQHYLGRAIDCFIGGISLLDAFQAAEEIGFKGIGVYPHWRNPGLHLDIREGKQIRWVQNADGEYEYLSSQGIINLLEFNKI